MINWISLENREPIGVIGKLLVWDGFEMKFAFWRSDFQVFQDTNGIVDNITHWAKIQDLNLPQ